MTDLREDLLATSIRMYSLYHTALSLCAVQRLSELIDVLLPHCITAMDVATACLLNRDGVLHIMGSALEEADKTYLKERFPPEGVLGKACAAHPCVHGSLPSGAFFLASPILQEPRDHLIGFYARTKGRDCEQCQKDIC